MKNSTIFIGGLVVLVVIFGGTAIWNATQPGPHDALAQCLADKDATFYGAYTCPHCQEQKELFGRSERHLPYVECATPGGQGQTEECLSADITGYPTWEFADGSRLQGVQSLETLAERTDCSIE